MKIKYGSDIHLEFSFLDHERIENTDNSDVLVLAGDIILASALSDMDDDFNRKNSIYHDFFQYCCKEYKDVIYIMGNHEHYKGDINKTYGRIKKYLGYLPNLHIVENEKVVIDDVTFLCATMWTDMNKNDPVTMNSISRLMNDFFIISKGSRTFHPKDAYKFHVETMEFFKNELDKTENKKVVMVTHHCPSMECIPDKYRGDVALNSGYMTDLSEFILDYPKISHWICGHSHNRMDFMLGNTNIVQNCRGYYSVEPMEVSFEFKTFEV